MALSTARLLIYCPDRRGIIASVTGFIARYGGNILDLDQHTDAQHREFFMRVEIDRQGLALDDRTFEAAWSPLAAEYAMRWHVHWGDRLKRMAVLVSREGHCLNDLLWRHRTGELPVEIPFVAGNHTDLRRDVEALGGTFHHVEVASNGKNQSEVRLVELLRATDVDFIVLARYMQVLSADFVARFPERIINIHHSFLPAFAGSKPYHQAYDRGVKLIGATSHYVTERLDDGPIIAQATHPVDHRDTIDHMIRAGRDLERMVLARAVRLHVEDKILVSKNKTVVFD